MSSMWGLTKIVVEGEKAKYVYDLLCRARQECGREECGYLSEVISVGKEYEGLFYHISCEADCIGETNDQEGKYSNLEEYEQEIYG